MSLTSIPSPGATPRPGRAADVTEGSRITTMTAAPGARRTVDRGGSDAAPAKSPADTTADAGSSALATPKPLRFPWLNRLSQQLESASKSKPTFPAAPVIGENVDRKV